MQYLKSLDNNQKNNEENCKTTNVESKSVKEIKKYDSEEYKEESDEVMQMQPLNEESEVILKKTLTNKSN